MCQGDHLDLERTKSEGVPKGLMGISKLSKAKKGYLFGQKIK